jgi:hypothetical protein
VIHAAIKLLPLFPVWPKPRVSQKEFKSMNDTTSLSDATIEELLHLNPALVHCNIRTDDKTQKGSVIDVVCLVTGKKSRHASETIENLPDELAGRVGQLRINGKGKLTPTPPPSWRSSGSFRERPPRRSVANRPT